MLTTPCLNRENLNQYLAGWTEESISEEIELHLQSCPKCESVCTELEKDANLRMVVPVAKSHYQSESDDPEIVNAVNAAKQILTSEPEVDRDPHSVLPTNYEVGPYELLEPLGHGAMGTVYLAKHRKLNRLVAIKLIPATRKHNDAQARFDREVLAAGQLQHTAIVAATDAGQSHGQHYLVMEYIRGLDLGRIARLIGPFPIADVCEIGHQMALGLSHAHSAGMVHRDVKPSNVMLDESGMVKILDFGLVLLDRWDGVSSELTSVGQFLGTLDYMAPEQAEHCGGVDYHADLYALGATLFRLLCGRPPLAAAPNQSPIEKLRLLANHRPPSLKTLRPDAPVQLIALIDQLLSTRPQDRPPSAAHVAERLSELTADADLKSLLEKAQNAALSLQPESAPPAHYPSSFFPVSGANRSRTGNRNRWRWIAAVGLPFLILSGLLGFLIVLETSKGQLVIDSEVADVHVKLLQNGEVAKELNIKTGISTTRLYADKYEIQIDSASDGVSIEKNQFIIKNGETVVARIRSNPSDIVNKSDSIRDILKGSASGLPLADSTQIAVPNDEKIYKGKTLPEWLAMLGQEQEREAWTEAFTAVNTLANSETKRRIRNEVLGQSLERRISTIESLKTWTEGQDLAKRLLLEIEERPKSRDFILGQVFRSNPNSDPADWDPIWKWLTENIRHPGIETRNLEATLRYLFETASSGRGGVNPQLRGSAGSSSFVLPQRYTTLKYVLQEFPYLGRKIVLPAMWKSVFRTDAAGRGRVGVGSDGSQVAIPGRTGGVQSDSKLNELTSYYTLELLEDTNASFEDRVTAADNIQAEDILSEEKRPRILRVLDELLLLCAKDRSKMKLELAHNRFPSFAPSFPGRSETTGSAVSILMNAARRFHIHELNDRPTKGLAAVIEAVRDDRKMAIDELPGLMTSVDMIEVHLPFPWRIPLANEPAVNLTPEQIERRDELVFATGCYAFALATLMTKDDSPSSIRSIINETARPYDLLDYRNKTESEKIVLNEDLKTLISIDKNKDGIITPAEWPASEGDFSAIDVHTNGEISLYEYHTYRHSKVQP